MASMGILPPPPQGLGLPWPGPTSLEGIPCQVSGWGARPGPPLAWQQEELRAGSSREVDVRTEDEGEDAGKGPGTTERCAQEGVCGQLPQHPTGEPSKGGQESLGSGVLAGGQGKGSWGAWCSRLHGGCRP